MEVLIVTNDKRGPRRHFHSESYWSARAKALESLLIEKRPSFH